MVICLERVVDLHTAQLMPLPLTVSCFSKIQIGFTFLVPAHPGSPGQRAVKRVCVCVCDGHDGLDGGRGQMAHCCQIQCHIQVGSLKLGLASRVRSMFVGAVDPPLE